MSEPKQKWYKSPAFIGLILTLAGFGLFTLAAKWLSERLIGQ
ncbi:MAG: hypothetical protein ACOY93_07060 [Bacillota bacterium]